MTDNTTSDRVDRIATALLVGILFMYGLACGAAIIDVLVRWSRQ